MSFDEGGKLRLGIGSDEAIDEPTLTEDKQRRDALDAEGLGRLRVVVHVELAERDAAGHLAREVCHDGTDDPARAAPGRPAIHDHGLMCLDESRQLGVIDVHEHSGSLLCRGSGRCLGGRDRGSMLALEPGADRGELGIVFHGQVPAPRAQSTCDAVAVGAAMRAHVFVSGKVQGVFYRDTTKKEADKRGIRGWVRNRRDGRVEAVFEGESLTVEEMVAWCRIGSPLSRPTFVDRTEEPEEGHADFVIRSTA